MRKKCCGCMVGQEGRVAAGSCALRQGPLWAEFAVSLQIDAAEAWSMDVCSYQECSGGACDSTKQMGLPRDASLSRKNTPENGAIQDTD